MSDLDETITLDPYESNGSIPEGPPASLLERLRADRQRRADELTLDLRVPGFRGAQVALRCGPLSPHDYSRFSDKRIAAAQKGQGLGFEFDADLLIAACREVVVRESEDDPWQSLAGANGGEPVRIDRKLVALLGLTPASDRAREVLRALYGGVPSPEIALDQASGRYLNWASGAAEELEDEFAGE